MSGVSDACRKKQTCRGRASSERAGVFAVTKHVSRTIPAPCQPSLIRRPALGFSESPPPALSQGRQQPPGRLLQQRLDALLRVSAFPDASKTERARAASSRPPKQQKTSSMGLEPTTFGVSCSENQRATIAPTARSRIDCEACSNYHCWFSLADVTGQCRLATSPW